MGYIIHNSLILPNFSFHLLLFLFNSLTIIYIYIYIYICWLYIVQFCGHSHKDVSLVRWGQHLNTGFTKIISEFKTGFNMASTTDEHIHLCLNYYSRFFNHVLLIITN